MKTKLSVWAFIFTLSICTSKVNADSILYGVSLAAGVNFKSFSLEDPSKFARYKNKPSGGGDAQVCLGYRWGNISKERWHLIFLIGPATRRYELQYSSFCASGLTLSTKGFSGGIVVKWVANPDDLVNFFIKGGLESYAVSKVYKVLGSFEIKDGLETIRGDYVEKLDNILNKWNLGPRFGFGVTFGAASLNIDVVFMLINQVSDNESTKQFFKSIDLEGVSIGHGMPSLCFGFDCILPYKEKE